MSTLAQRTQTRDRAHGRGSVMAALDIGSSKVACLIARRADSTEGEPRIAGAGAQGTKGVRSGAVVDLDNLERSIRLAVEQAIPLTVFLTGICMNTGDRYLIIRDFGVHTDIDVLVREVFVELEKAIIEHPSAWHFWSESERFFR